MTGKGIQRLGRPSWSGGTLRSLFARRIDCLVGLHLYIYISFSRYSYLNIIASHVNCSRTGSSLIPLYSNIPTLPSVLRTHRHLFGSSLVNMLYSMIYAKYHISFPSWSTLYSAHLVILFTYVASSWLTPHLTIINSCPHI
jgi:hypothetical protein